MIGSDFPPPDSRSTVLPAELAPPASPYDPAWPSRSASPVPAGFWRRVLAFSLDVAVIALIGQLLGALWFESLAAFGQYGLAVGAFALLLYFGLLGSRWGGGATLGKRAFSLRLVDADGGYLDPGVSIARAAVVVIPWVVVQLSVPPGLLATFHTAGAWAAVGVLFCCGYLFIFNTPSRRSLPDVITGTSVVRVTSDLVPMGPPEQRALWRGHYVVAVLVMVAVLGTRAMLPSPALDADDGAGIDRVRTALQREFDTVRVGAHLGYALSWNLAAVPGLGDNARLGESRYVTVSVGLAGAPESFEAVVSRVATTLLLQFPEAFRRDSIEITVLYGYDIGIAEKWIGRTIGLDPIQWRERIGAQSIPA